MSEAEEFSRSIGSVAERYYGKPSPQESRPMTDQEAADVLLGHSEHVGYFFGEPISAMSRERLLELVQWLMQEWTRERAERYGTITALADGLHFRAHSPSAPRVWR